MCTQKIHKHLLLHCTITQSRNVLKTNIRMKLNPKPCLQGNWDEHNIYAPNTKAEFRQIRARRLSWTFGCAPQRTLRFVVWSVQFECRQQTEHIYSKSISKPMLCVVVAASLMVALLDEAVGSENMLYCCCCCWCVALLLLSYVCGGPYGTRRMYSNEQKNCYTWTCIWKYNKLV